MRALGRFAVLSFALVALACSDPSRSEDEEVAGFEISGNLATALDETMSIRLQGLDARGRYTSSYAFRLRSATCDAPGCSVTIDGNGSWLHVVAASAGVHKVTVRTNVAAAPEIVIDAPFRTATKLVVRRAIGSAYAGSAYAMVPTDRQTWIVTPGDDDGPLGADPRGLLVESPEEVVRCHARRRADDAAGVFGTPDLELGCLLEPRAPGAFQVTFRYRELQRSETVQVIPLASVRDATLLVCTEEQIRAGNRLNSFSVPELLPIDAKDLPCEAASVVRVPGVGCAGAERQYVVPRLVLEDGTVALGGAAFLAADDAPTRPVYEVYELRGSRMIRAKLGGASLSVPVTTEPDCSGGP